MEAVLSHKLIKLTVKGLNPSWPFREPGAIFLNEKHQHKLYPPSTLHFCLSFDLLLSVEQVVCSRGTLRRLIPTLYSLAHYFPSSKEPRDRES